MSRTRFLDKTLLTVANAAQQSLFSETFAARRGVLQALEVRTKLLTFLSIIVLISFLHRPGTLWVLYGASLVLAAWSRVDIGFFIKRVWFFVPLFSAAIVLPSLLNIVTPGTPLWVLWKLPHPYTWGPYTIPAEIAVTRQGLRGGIVFISRVVASVSFAVLFTLTTRWAEVFAGLRSLFVPRVFIVTIQMTERYLFVFLRMIQDMYRARKSRTIRPLAPAAERNWTASRIGAAFKKSMEMSEDIYKAMLSRGFRGEFRSLRVRRATVRDYCWAASVCLLGGILILFEKGLLRI